MKALIVDDEKHVREGIKILADWKQYNIHAVLEAEDGEEAITLIEECKPELIFTDMRMPKMDGISLLKWLNTTNQNSVVIVVSGHEDYKYMRSAINYNSFDYILKPIDPEILNEALERAVEKWKETNKTSKDELTNSKKSLSKVAQYICEHYEEDLTLQHIADKFYLSREHLSRKFKQEYGQTITDYLTEIRIKKAKELLLQPNYKIYEVAYLVGYQDEKYFSKVFKRVVHVTPNDFRNSFITKQ
ncbi:response regulator transcription factor [Bacillus alkalisoli]|uniref:response regulator transcription factor n=1 Tax=Bacillus alkalisoli TaxID=2011008 RepID=UPI000C2411E5|nr:response regulator [Bacillus alkalisoli]